MLHLRPMEQQRDTGHHEEEGHTVSASRPGLCTHGKDPTSDGVSIWKGIVHAVNVCAVKTQAVSNQN